MHRWDGTAKCGLRLGILVVGGARFHKERKTRKMRRLREAVHCESGARRQAKVLLERMQAVEQKTPWQDSSALVCQERTPLETIRFLPDNLQLHSRIRKKMNPMRPISLSQVKLKVLSTPMGLYLFATLGGFAGGFWLRRVPSHPEGDHGLSGRENTE